MDGCFGSRVWPGPTGRRGWVTCWEWLESSLTAVRIVQGQEQQIALALTLQRRTEDMKLRGPRLVPFVVLVDVSEGASDAPS